MSPSPPFHELDIHRLKSQGISEAEALAQLEILHRGFQPVRLDRPCSAGDGVRVLDERDGRRLQALYEDKVQGPGRATKFVPASGAASRMFSLLSAYVGANQNAAQPARPEGKVLEFFQNINRFAFADDLAKAMGVDMEALPRFVEEGDYVSLLKTLLSPQGLNYEKLPKGLIPFHRYPDGVRTAMEEQLAEGAAYVLDQNRRARIHLTVTPDAQNWVRSFLEEFLFDKPSLNTTWDVSMSLQKPATQTVALDAAGEPFRDAAGQLVLRPGGHGSLLANLEELGGDVVFLKNIDNVLPEGHADVHHLYKKILGGQLWELREQLFALLNKLDKGGDASAFAAAEAWAATLGYRIPAEILGSGDPKKKSERLLAWLNRPLRVCGVVKNSGEPGGGPFWVRDREGNVTPQIVESAQVDPKDPAQAAIFRSSTHFNPVDLVCQLKDYRGRPFRLGDFVDPETWFLSSKTEGGKPLTALERPGLWNGAMAKWFTVFVEVPLATFSPVKTVFDLLRPEHLSESPL